MIWLNLWELSINLSRCSINNTKSSYSKCNVWREYQPWVLSGKEVDPARLSDHGSCRLGWVPSLTLRPHRGHPYAASPARSGPVRFGPVRPSRPGSIYPACRGVQYIISSHLNMIRLPNTSSHVYMLIHLFDTTRAFLSGAHRTILTGTINRYNIIHTMGCLSGPLNFWLWKKKSTNANQ